MSVGHRRRDRPAPPRRGRAASPARPRSPAARPRDSPRPATATPRTCPAPPPAPRAAVTANTRRDTCASAVVRAPRGMPPAADRVAAHRHVQRASCGRGQLTRRLEPLGRLLGHALGDHLVERRQPRVDRRRPRHRLTPCGRRSAARGCPRDTAAARQALVEHARQRVDVRARIDWPPSNRSGAMYASVPSVLPAVVMPASPAVRARPKSIRYTKSRSVIRMFDGLTSRWIRPAACAASSAVRDLLDDLDRERRVQRFLASR